MLKPEMSSGNRWRIQMKKIILAVFTALSLTAAVAPMASAATMGTFYPNNANNPTAGGGG
jgi:hypothetical protein